MRDAIFTGEIVEGRGFLHGRNQNIDRIGITIRQENRARLRVEGIDMTNAVELLLLERVLMLFDNVLEVIIDRAARNDTRLRALVHRELIQIETRHRLGDERAIGAARIEELTSFRIHLGGIHIGISRKLRFRAIDIEERKRLTIDGGDGLGSVVHVVRKRRDPVGDACGWSNSSKRFNNHRKTPLPQMDRRTVP